MNSIDVIVPCYRYGRFLSECLDSIFTQGLDDARVLIIDDASPDDTAEIAQELASEDPRIHFVRHAANRGHIATFNEGLEWASARHVLLLSADDYLLPGALARAVNFLDAHPGVGFVFGKAMEQYPTGPSRLLSSPAHAARHGSHVLAGLQFIELSGPRNLVPTPTAVVRNALQKQVGGYKPNLPHTGDMEMWLRLAAHADVGVIDACQAVYRRHDSNMSLAYANATTCVPDFLERQAAVEAFFAADGGGLANAAALHERMLDQLARDAISRASIAFNEGNLALCEQLRELAARLSAPAVRSLPWLKLSAKLAMGCSAWARMQALREAWSGEPAEPARQQRT